MFHAIGHKLTETMFVSKPPSKESNELPSGGVSLRVILQKHEDQLIDHNRNICLLCKRKFTTHDQIDRHKSLSQLHVLRLKRLRKRLFSGEQLDRIERREREALYRDRAKERRLKYGISDKLVKIENPYSNSRSAKRNESSTLMETHSSGGNTNQAETDIGKDNKGAALLSKMGWKEGTGLGKDNQGRTGIIQLNAQVGTSGLGAKKYKINPKSSYRDAVKQIMLQRYYELSSEEEEEQK